MRTQAYACARTCVLTCVLCKRTVCVLCVLCVRNVYVLCVLCVRMRTHVPTHNMHGTDVSNLFLLNKFVYYQTKKIFWLNFKEFVKTPE